MREGEGETRRRGDRGSGEVEVGVVFLVGGLTVDGAALCRDEQTRRRRGRDSGGEEGEVASFRGQSALGRGGDGLSKSKWKK